MDMMANSFFLPLGHILQLVFFVKKGMAVNHGFVLNHQTLCVFHVIFEIKIIDLFGTNRFQTLNL